MSFTLEDLYAATKASYPGYELALPSGATLDLRNALRLSKAERKSFSELQKELSGKVELPDIDQERREGESDEDHAARVEAETDALMEASDRIEATRKATLHKLFRLLAADKESAKEALSIFGDDLGVLMTLIGQYMEATQAGGSLSLADLIDRYGEGLYSDLLPRGVNLLDVVAGRGPAPRFVLSVVAGLPLGSAFVSMVLAEKRGGDWKEYLGKTHEWFAMADLIDAMNLNTAATGNFKKGKGPKFDPYHRPGDPEIERKNRKSKAGELAGPEANKASLLEAIFNNLGGAGAR